MAHRKLVEFIRAQHARGHAIEEIQNYLLQKGFHIDDIEEAIRVMERRHPTMLFYISAGILLLLAVLGIFLLMGGDEPIEQMPSCTDCQFLSDGKCIDYDCCSDSDCAVNNTCENHACVQIEYVETIEENTTNETVETDSIASEETVNVVEPPTCQYFDCLIDAARNCSAASADRTDTIGIDGQLRTRTIRYYVDDECIYRSIYMEKSVEFSDTLIDSLRVNHTEQEIELLQKRANESQQKQIGSGMRCEFESSLDLVNILKKIESGTLVESATCDNDECFYSGDWSVAECELILP